MGKLAKKFSTLRREKKSDEMGPSPANVRLFLDGVPLSCVKSLKIDMEARQLTRVTIEMYVNVEGELSCVLGELEKGGWDVAGQSIVDKTGV